MKTALITGATNGIGLETAKALLEKDFSVYMIARNKSKAEKVCQDLIAETGNKNCHYYIADLASLVSVKAVAKTINSDLQKIDVLINNAGGIFQEREESKDGIEMHFAMNHLAHFLLTNELEMLLKASDARIVSLSSEAHRMANLNLDNIQEKESYNAMRIYGNAKLCNILFTKGLVKRWGKDGVTAYCLHPGVVRTGFAMNADGGAWKLIFKLARPFMISASKGAETSAYCATEEGIELYSGKYFKSCKVTKPSAAAENEALADRLWQISQQLISEKLT
jgi:NAD(P)-dependent dehydrogenase (short-subunit alcohol dehydrogenase family)